MATVDMAAVGQRLRGQVAVVTGSGGGIGRGCAVALAAEGADVVLIGRTADILEETAALIREQGGQVLITPADVADEASVRSVVDTIRDRFGRLDILVNNAGTNTAKRSFAETELSGWNRVVATNLTGIFVMTQAILPIMREQPQGTIINVSSLAGKGAVAVAGLAYNATKMGVNALTQMVNLEEWQHNIRATTVYPGETMTPLLARRPVPVPPERRPLILQPEDLGATVVYIATLPQRVLVEEVVIRPVTRA